MRIDNEYNLLPHILLWGSFYVQTVLPIPLLLSVFFLPF